MNALGILGRLSCLSLLTMVLIGSADAQSVDLDCAFLPNQVDLGLTWGGVDPDWTVEVCVNDELVQTLPGTSSSTFLRNFPLGLVTICIKVYEDGVFLDEACCEIEVEFQNDCEQIPGTQDVLVSWPTTVPNYTVEVTVNAVTVATVPASQGSYLVTNLSPGLHTICSTLFDVTGEQLALSCCEVEIIEVTPAITCDEVPGTLNATISWTGIDPATPVRICLDGNAVGSALGSAGQFTVEGISPGGHTICVKEVNADGDILSETCCEVVILAIETVFVRGDSNGDLVVNLPDGIYILNFLFNQGPPPPCEVAADANGDGSVSLADGIFVLNYLFVTGIEPEQPFPDCGGTSLPTDSNLSCEFPTCPQ